jgi:anti-sigma B factor antagonist
MLLSASIDQHAEGPAVVTLAGRMTLGSSLSLVESQVRSAINGGTRNMVFDLTGVELVDSAGLGMMIHVYGSLRSRSGTLRLCGVAPRVLSLLELTKMDTLLAIDPTLKDSLAALSA